jgi:hypothetical protein
MTPTKAVAADDTIASIAINPDKSYLPPIYLIRVFGVVLVEA